MPRAHLVAQESGAVGICIVWIMTNAFLIYESAIYNIGRRQQEGDIWNLGVSPIRFDHNAVRTFTMQPECLQSLRVVVKNLPTEFNTSSTQQYQDQIKKYRVGDQDKQKKWPVSSTGHDSHSGTVTFFPPSPSSCFQGVWRAAPPAWNSSPPPRWSWSPAGCPLPASPPHPVCDHDRQRARWLCQRRHATPGTSPPPSRLSPFDLLPDHHPALPTDPGPWPACLWTDRPAGSERSAACSADAPSGTSESPCGPPWSAVGWRRGGTMEAPEERTRKTGTCPVRSGRVFSHRTSGREGGSGRRPWPESWPGWSSWRKEGFFLSSLAAEKVPTSDEAHRLSQTLKGSRSKSQVKQRQRSQSG